MFTRKNKRGEVNKKTRKDKDSKSNQQKGGGLTAEEEKTYYETLVSIIYDSDLEKNFGVAGELLQSLQDVGQTYSDENNITITNLKGSLDLINLYNKIIFYDNAIRPMNFKKTLSDNERIKYLKETYGKAIDDLKEQVNRVSQIIFDYSGELTNDKTLLYILLNEFTIYYDNLQNNLSNESNDKIREINKKKIENFNIFLNKVNKPSEAKKTEEASSKSTEELSIKGFNIFPPDNSKNSCWLNSILMALLVPAYLDYGQNSEKLKETITNDNIKEYIDSYFTESVNRQTGAQILQDIKGKIFNGASIKNNFQNVNSFLENELFNIYFNNSNAIDKYIYDRTKPENQETLTKKLYYMPDKKYTIMFSNKDEVAQNDKDNFIFSIDQTIQMNGTKKEQIKKSYEYEIKTKLRYLIFQCDGEGNFTESLQQLFLKDELKAGDKTYKRVSFVLASGGHYVSVVKKDNSYYLIDDLPPTIKIFSNDDVAKMIRNRSQKIQKYYYLNVIVYMLDETQPAALIEPSNSTSPSMEPSDSTSTSTSTKPIDNSTSIQKTSLQDIKDDTLNKSLIEEANKTMELTKDASFSSSDDTEKSLTDAANVAIETQKIVINNEIQSDQPSQPTSSKQYAIEFDADEKIKIVTDPIQTPAQSLSEEIEDHYFKGNKYYKPTETNQYTVTVTKDITGKITINI